MNAERVLARRGRKFLRVRSGDRRRTQHTHFFTGTGTVQSGRRVISDDDQSRTSIIISEAASSGEAPEGEMQHRIGRAPNTEYVPIASKMLTVYLSQDTVHRAWALLT